MSAKRIVVGMSGGVDSSVAALLLKQQGHEVVGLFMKNWEDDDTEQYCTSREDLVDAVAVADTIGIDIETVNFSAEYKDRVFAEFLREYRAGRTPNPDVLCNAEIKFKAFLEHAIRLGGDLIATGHYARATAATPYPIELRRAADRDKDQTYFLHRLEQAQLARTRFPLGDLTKRQVRALAREHGLAVHAKRDSTGICFIGERPFRAFLSRYLPTEPGEIRSPEGELLGRHLGLMYYTLGQRQGLGIGGKAGGTGAGWYVAAKELATNTLIVVQGHDHPRLLKRSVAFSQAHWIADRAPSRGFRCTAKTRYRQQDAPCTFSQLDGSHGRVEFDVPQWAVTPGQSIVFYQDQVCLGGGVIEAEGADNRMAA